MASEASSTELRIAEMLAQDKTYREITRELHVGPETIKTVRDYMAQGIITIGEDGKALLAKPAAKTVEGIHTEVVDVVTKKASEVALQNAEEDYALGNEIRQYWSLKAQELGMGVREFVRAALIFYDDYRDKIKELEENKEISATILQTLQMDIVRTTKMELFYKLVRYCLFLKSRGLSVPSQVLTDFYQDLSMIEKSGELQMKGLKT